MPDEVLYDWGWFFIAMFVVPQIDHRQVWHVWGPDLHSTPLVMSLTGAHFWRIGVVDLPHGLECIRGLTSPSLARLDLICTRRASITRTSALSAALHPV
jgi:hypothetical protein